MIEIKPTPNIKIEEFKPEENVFVVRIINESSDSKLLKKNIPSCFIQIYFSVKGEQQFIFGDKNEAIHLSAGNLLALYDPNVQLQLGLTVRPQSEMVLLVVSLNRLHELFSKHDFEAGIFRSGFSRRNYMRAHFSERIAEILRNFEIPRMPEKLQNIYAKGKLYELMALYFSENQEVSASFCPYLNHEETAEKLRKARELLVADFSVSPTIKELAKTCELSEHKLKEGFKKLYGKSVHRFLIDYKLDISRKKLDSNPSIKINELSFEMGYENPSHFISTFKKRFSLTPLQYAKKNRLLN